MLIENAKILNIVKEENGYLFKTDFILNGEPLDFDTENVDKVLQLSPIKSKEVYGSNSTLEIVYSLVFDADKEIYELKMFLKDDKGTELLGKEEITLLQMLQILVDSYTNSSYMTSHQLITRKISKLDNELNSTLLSQGLFPSCNFILEGKGKVISSINKETLGIFDRVFINSAVDEIILCEYTGTVLTDLDCEVSIETNMGIEVKLPSLIFAGKNGEILELKYASMRCRTPEVSIAKACQLLVIDSVVEANTDLQVMDSAALSNMSYNKVIDEAVAYVNKNNDTDSIVSYTVRKKNILFENASINDIESIADELFDDLDF